jgi:hypothetical protein
MPTYARPQDGIVAELFTTPAGAAIGDCFHAGVTWIDVSSVAGIAVGWAATQTGGAWSFGPPPPPPAPTPPQQADILTGQGLAVTFTQTPALSGTYATTPDWQNKVTAVALYCQVNGHFPRNAAALNWPDAAGNLHSFTTTAQFIALSSAIGDFVAGVDEGAASGTFPPATATIDL